MGSLSVSLSGGFNYGTYAAGGSCASGNCAQTPAAGGASQAITPQQQQELAALKARDREVRAHEAAHQAAAGSLATSGASFTYQKGPDGQLYAIGGEVNIDTSSVSGDPEATIRKARQIIAAALAPAEPSGPDRSVAAAATQMQASAQAELNRQRLQQSGYGAEPITGNHAAGQLVNISA